MSMTLIAALFFTVAMLVTNAYFLMGSLPLLVLEHDTPLDGRFVRGFFDTYYLFATGTAGAASLSYALAVRPWPAAGAAALTLMAVLLRRKVLAKMDALRSQIEASGEAAAIRGFRRTHMFAIAMNLLQLVAIVWSLIVGSMRGAQ